MNKNKGVPKSGLKTYSPAQILARTGKLEWIVPTFIPKGVLTTWTGEQKTAGKSTLLREMFRAVCTGDRFIDYQCQKGPVLYLTEELDAELAPALRAHDLERVENLHILQWTDTTEFTWAQLIQRVSRYVQEHNVCWVIVDTFAQFILTAGMDENSSSDISTAIKPLQTMIHDTGVACTIVQHTRKKGGSTSTAARGSSASGAAVGQQNYIRAKNEETTEREIKSNGRITGIPYKRVLDWDGFEYTQVDIAWGALSKKRKEYDKLLRTLPGTKEEIAKALGLSEPTIRRRLQRLVSARKIGCTGKGVKGDPLVYCRLTSEDE